MHWRSVDVVGRLAVFTQVTRVAFNRFALVVTNALRVGLYETTIEDAAGETLVVVRFNGFEIMDRDTSLIADLAQADATLLTGESQLFAYTRCHLQSLDSWSRGWSDY